MYYKNFYIALKLLRLVGHILWGVILAIFLFSQKLALPRRWQITVVKAWSQKLCRICRLDIHCYGEISPGPTLFVANHISWLDIYVLLAVFPVTFVSKQEVARWPIIGWLVQRVGTLFIARGQFRAATEASDSIVTALHNQTNVLFFPEGTSTRGNSVKRFHARLFQAAVQTGVPVQPIALRYPQATGLNQVVPYVDNISLITHLWGVLGEKQLTAEIWFCPPIETHCKKRRELAEYAQTEITKVLDKNCDLPDLNPLINR